MTHSSVLRVMVSTVEAMSKARALQANNIKPIAEIILGLLGIVLLGKILAELMATA